MADIGGRMALGYLTGPPLLIRDYAQLVGREVNSEQNNAAAG